LNSDDIAIAQDAICREIKTTEERLELIPLGTVHTEYVTCRRWRF